MVRADADADADAYAYAYAMQTTLLVVVNGLWHVSEVDMVTYLIWLLQCLIH